MKKIIYTISIGVFALSVASCNLERNPETGILDEFAYTHEYCQGMRAAAYNRVKGYLTGSHIMTPDLYVDQITPSLPVTSGNTARFVSAWDINYTTGETGSMWTTFYSGVYQTNAGIGHLQETLRRNEISAEDAKKIEGYLAELHFFRAWIMYRATLLFCDMPALTEAEQNVQQGLPYPKAADPELKLSRGTMRELLSNIDADIATAEATVTEQNGYTNKQGSIYLTPDAIKAFKAEYALLRRDYSTAATLAGELIASGRYPLGTDASDLETMLRQDVSTENILTLDLTRTTMGTAGSYGDYVGANYDREEEMFVCSPSFVPQQQLVDLFADPDYRYGLYVSVPVPYDDTNGYQTPQGKQGLINGIPSEIRYTETERSKGGVMIVKFLGNASFQYNSTAFTYINKPRMFRIAEVYLIAAEAQYRTGGDALTPLNALRVSRGLPELTGVTGDDLFLEIKKERQRELIGEGDRLYDLKRWDEGFKRNLQTRMVVDNCIDEQAVAYQLEMEQAKPSETTTRYVWPIPFTEFERNPSFVQNVDQNPGY